MRSVPAQKSSEENSRTSAELKSEVLYGRIEDGGSFREILKGLAESIAIRRPGCPKNKVGYLVGFARWPAFKIGKG